MSPDELAEIRSARMQIAARSELDGELKEAISNVLAKHNVLLSPDIMSELLLTTASEFESAFGPGQPLPVGIQCK